MSKRKELTQVLRDLNDGWRHEHTRGGHVKIVAPDGSPIFTASTPSDWRGHRNLVALLRRRGALPPRQI